MLSRLVNLENNYFVPLKFYVALPVVFELERKGLHTHNKTIHFLRPSQISQRFLQVSSSRETCTPFFFFIHI